MSTRDADRLELLQGTLDLLILQTLARATLHGHAIAQSIERQSEEVLQVGYGSLYPALQRLLKQGLIVAGDGISENNRAARFYKLTPKGHKKWRRLYAAIVRVLTPLPQGN
jgi:transcriptional regulator